MFISVGGPLTSIPEESWAVRRSTEVVTALILTRNFSE